MRPTSTYRLTSSITLLATVVWTLVVGISLLWMLRSHEQETMDTAYAEARANLNKDITLRRWASDHGGVYVPITEKQKSVPWLGHVPGRDVTTTDGRQLTLLNPASVARQMMDRYAQDYGIRGRITGLKYLNPGNAPDPWEKLQLEAFTRGERQEVWEATNLDGLPHLRYLRAMFMEPGCEKCHAILGYKLGDMRGATGLNLPLAPYFQQIEDTRRDFGLTHGAIWLLGLAGIGFSSIMARRREQELRLSQAIINSTDDAIISETLDGVIKSWNSGAEIIFGYTAEETIGNSIQMLVPQDRQGEEPAILARISRGEKIHQLETVRRCKNGRLIDISATISPILDGSGKVIGTSKIARDITERKETEAARASLEAQLRESQKMQAIGTLAGGIAHDFNNVIATILGNVELAREDASGNPVTLESLEEIRKASSRARDLVQQILSFGRRAPPARKPIALAPIVEESVRLLRAILPARVALEAHCDAGLPAAQADITQVKQVLINLATNAMQAMGGKPGRIDIRLDAVTLDAALAKTHPQLGAMHAKHTGRTLRLVLSDDGQGMDAATLERIFEPFFTTKAVNDGTGLGLSVVHGIVQGHDGAILVESTPGKGTHFTIYLPAAAEAEAGAPAPGATQGAAGGSEAAGLPALKLDGGQHFLYIDDDESLVFLVQRLLERRGFRVSGYTDQGEALAALRADPTGFDLLVTDYNMPGMSGLDVAREVRAIRADLPVAVASGFIDEELRAQAGGAGVRELIFKADAAEDLCEAFARLAQTVQGTSKAS